MYTLKNWSIVTDSSPTTAPETKYFRLHGNVYNNPNFLDGESIITSAINSFDEEENAVITYSGSKYIIEDVNPEYEKEYPDAYNRFVNSLKAFGLIKEH